MSFFLFPPCFMQLKVKRIKKKIHCDRLTFCIFCLFPFYEKLTFWDCCLLPKNCTGSKLSKFVVLLFASVRFQFVACFLFLLSEGRAKTVFQSTFSLKIDFKWTWSQWWTCRWRCRRPSWPDVTLQLSSGYDTSNRFLVLFSLDPVLQIHGLISKSIFGPYLTTLMCSFF